MKKLPWILFLLALVSIPVTAYSTLKFSDVSEDDWFFDAVSNLQQSKIVQGYADGTFKPENNISRAEMAVMMDRLMDSIRKGCIYEGEFYLNGDLLYEDAYQESYCNNGREDTDTWEPISLWNDEDEELTLYTAESWQTMIPDTCQSFFDGCNNCSRTENASEAACTLMYCEQYQEPKCLDE